MNPVERAIRRVDRAQQRNPVGAFIVGVIKKYGDDNGGTLTASLAHSAFLSLFPLLLILITVLGLVVAGNQALYQDVLNAVAQQFPAGGDQLTNISALRRSSVIGLIIGLIGLLWVPPAWLRRDCSRWNRYGTCRARRGLGSCRDWVCWMMKTMASVSAATRVWKTVSHRAGNPTAMLIRTQIRAALSTTEADASGYRVPASRRR